MRRKVATGLTATALALTGLAAAPALPGASPLFALPGAQAATKTLGASGGGGGNLGGAGQRFLGLASEIAIPAIIAVGGWMLLGALVSRNVAACLGIVFVTFVGLIFFIAPGAIEGAAKQIANVVF
jgi:hypothetical protein